MYARVTVQNNLPIVLNKTKTGENMALRPKKVKFLKVVTDVAVEIRFAKGEKGNFSDRDSCGEIIEPNVK